MITVHQVLGWVVVILCGIVGVWALAAHRNKALRGRAMFSLTWAAWGALSAQVTVGALLIQTADPAPPQIHYFYGALCLAAVAIIYSYRPQVEQWQYLLYGGGNLFIMGLAVRSMILQTP